MAGSSSSQKKDLFSEVESDEAKKFLKPFRDIFIFVGGWGSQLCTDGLRKKVLKLRAATTVAPPSMKKAVHLLRDYINKRLARIWAKYYVDADFIAVGAVDPIEPYSIYKIYKNEGSPLYKAKKIRGNTFAGGSGATKIEGDYLDAYQADFTVNESIRFGRRAIEIAVEKDWDCGGTVYLFDITRDGANKHVFAKKNHKLASDKYVALGKPEPVTGEYINE